MAKRTPTAQPSAATGSDDAIQSGAAAPSDDATVHAAVALNADVAQQEGDDRGADVVGTIPAVGLIATLASASRDAARAGDASLHAYLETVVIAAHALKLRLGEPRPDLAEPVASALDGLSTIL